MKKIIKVGIFIAFKWIYWYILNIKLSQGGEEILEQTKLVHEF